MVWARLTLDLYETYARRHGTPDLLHAHNALYGGYAAALIAERYGIPCVVTEHHSSFLTGGPPANRHDLIRRAYGRVSRVITVSSALERAVTPFVSHDRRVIIPNLVDTDFFAPPEQEPAAEPFTILTLARLVSEKQIGLLIRAFAVFHARTAGIRLVIGGDGPCRGELEETCRRLEIRNRVTFTGALSREGVRDLLRSAHLFVLPSSVETFGVVLIEALATGVPIIAARSGGPEDIVTDSRGLLVAPDDVAGLEQAIKRMYEERDRYGRAGLRTGAVENFGHQAIAGRLLGLYRDVLAETTACH
jgi:glycosyltransferase involved in cell wall biosynthesis